MLPSHSPRNRAQKRNNPFGRKTSPVARSGSLLGTIKNIVTAPLTWFANGDDFEDGKGKRRRAAKPTSATDGSDEELVRSRVKRMRLDSPDRQVSSGYLDPPEAILPAPTSIPRYPYQYNQASKPGRSHSSLHPPNQRQLHHSRTLSPYPTSYSQSNEVHRTMSMDPPSRQPVPRDSYGPSHLRRETSMDSAMHRSSSLSIPRDFSASPTRSGFRMRTSVTPQPSGSSFGPTLQRRPRDPSEPPPLTSLVSNPIFVKPPPEARQRQMSVQPTITLGSLMDSERARSPVRQHSSLLFGSSSGPSSSLTTSTLMQPLNPAERALQELDVYKTPLLPSRFRDSKAVPDMFKAKKTSIPTPMHSEKDGDKHRLGMPRKSKGKGKEESNGTKPYAGEGGMKKMLAKRRIEEIEDKKVEKAVGTEEEGENMQTDVETPAPAILEKEQIPSSQELAPTAQDFFAPGTLGREGSSLRVGRTRTSRAHISRPVSRPKNRFSAVYEEEESDDQMLTTPVTQDDNQASTESIFDQAVKKAPAYEPPPGFSFAREAPPIEHDAKAKEPPISALPFSLTRAAPTVRVTMPTKPVQRDSPSTFEAPPVVAPSTPTLPPTDTETPEAPAPASTPAAIPNFFANSSLFSKPVTVTPPPLTFSPVVTPKQPDHNEATGSFATALPPAIPPVPAVAEGQKKSPKVSLGGSEEGLSQSRVESPATHVTPGTAPVDGFGGPSQPSISAPTLSFATPFITKESPNSRKEVSSFGSVPQGSKATGSDIFGVSETEPAKQTIRFGHAAPQPLFSGFGTASSSINPTKEPPANGLIFGQPPPGEIASASIEPPKTSSALLSFGQTSSKTSNEKDVPSQSPFSFGAPPSTPPPASDKKVAFGTNQSATVPLGTSVFNFGTPLSTSSPAADVSSKTLTFGTTSAPPRPVTPPKQEQEMRMEESPMRSMEASGHTSSRVEEKSLGGFGFGSSFGRSAPPVATGPAPFSFGDPSPVTSTSGFAFGQKAAEPVITTSSPFTFGQKSTGTVQAPATTSFSFGQSSSTPTPTPTSTLPPFSFGASSSPSATSFGQTAPSAGSAPNSPSTFAQPSPFSFAAPGGTSGFGFTSSQPASPAAPSISLPQPPGSSGGGFSFGAPATTPTAPQPPSNPFGSPSGGSSNLFTIGAAPSAPPASGSRTIKKLPMRRVVKR